MKLCRYDGVSAKPDYVEINSLVLEVFWISSLSVLIVVGSPVATSRLMCMVGVCSRFFAY